MSSFAKITKHPNDGKYYLARWIDDYFAPHVYGVKFPEDDKVYPVDLVESRQIDSFWKDDVIAAFQYVMGFEGSDEAVITFLNQIEKEYKARWARDPFRGEGAYLPCEHVVQGGECIYCNLVIEEE